MGDTMNFGIIYNKSNMNVGDDIQAYATARFLPRVDYFIDRETIDTFQSDNGEPVAVIMNAWYMWHKWNWPPSKTIYPLMTGFHYADHELANQWYGSPLKFQFLSGVGGAYLNAYGPVGCRDLFTLERLRENGIAAYFSGCITLTLPNMPARADRGQYVCVVDVLKKGRDKIHELLDEKIEVREFSHLRERDETLSWDDRQAMVRELLTTYQNARCVVTRRLHCALPCLAMGVPVLLVRGSEDDTRFDPYYDWLHHATLDDFVSGNFDYDFLNPPANKDDYLPYRESLAKAAADFAAQAQAETRTVDALNKLGATEEEIIRWRHDVMKQALDLWLEDDHAKMQTLAYAKDSLRRSDAELVRMMKRYDALQRKMNRTIAKAERYQKESLPKVIVRRITKRYWNEWD